MKSSDRAILASLLVVGLAAVFWFFLLSPKREEASELADRVTQLEQSIAEQEQVATFAEQARQEFPRFYGRMVVLGKAVPERGDEASLLVQLSQVSRDAKVRFQGITLGSASGAAEAPPPPPTPAEAATQPTATDAPGEDGDESAAPAETVPATEALAASLPIGASIGPAGLPVLPYDLTFTGGFFEVADFIKGIDGLVHSRSGGKVSVNGRLLTIDGFALTANPARGFPWLEANFAVTAYATPSLEGLTLGATPGGPAEPVPEVTPASTEVAPQ